MKPNLVAIIMVWAIQTTVFAQEASWFDLWQAKPKAPPAEPARPVVSAEDTARKATRDWQRRSAVCLKLREIGTRLNDAELIRQADQLEERAFDVYLRKTGRVVQADVQK